MATKSLPSFQHKSIGAKTHAPGTARKHMIYIMRDSAMTKFQAENMPGGGRGTAGFFDRLWEKAGMPENARIADQFIIALPLELTAQQRHEAVHSFMQSLGKGRIPWCAAHHDKGKDAHNPHVHILFKDADIDTGRKVIGTTTNTKDVREAKEKGWKVPPRTTTRDMRNAWCDHLNRIMEREGVEVRFDARKLKEQGIEREAQIHIGPTAKSLTAKDHEFESRDAQRGDRTLPYSLLDDGTRAEHNAAIVEANRLREREAQQRPRPGDEARGEQTLAQALSRENREKRELRETQALARQALYAEQARDREALRTAHVAEKREHESWAKRLYAQARDAAFQAVKAEHAEMWEEVRTIESEKERDKAAGALKREQAASYKRESDERVKQARPVKDKAWKTMNEAQDKERLDLRARHREETAALTRRQIAERNAMHEKWRAQELDRQSNRLEKRLSANPGMVAQQSAAMATLKFRQRASKTGQVNGALPAPANPQAAAKQFLGQAQIEQQKGIGLRAILTAQREDNIRRTPTPEPRRANAGGRPRKHFHDPAAQDTQNKLRQAAESGHTLTDADRANASPDLRERLDRSDRRAAGRRDFTSMPDRHSERGGKGRAGGGRGR